MSIKDILVSFGTSLFVCSGVIGVIVFVGLYYWLTPKDVEPETRWDLGE
jgi:hypothetical protein